MSTPTPYCISAIACVTMGRQGRIKRIDIQSTADVRALAQWCAMPMAHAGTRRIVLEAGCVALLLDAAQRIGEVERA